MRVFLNELALAEACANSKIIYSPLEALLNKWVITKQHSDILEVTNSAFDIPVCSNNSLRQVVYQLPRDKRGLFLKWLHRRLEFKSHEIPDNLFYFEQYDVTNGGLGAISRCVLLGQDALAFSPTQDSNSKFRRNQLLIVQGLLQEPICSILICNYWKIDNLVKYLKTLIPPPSSWRELLDQCSSKYNKLQIEDHRCYKVLSRSPYKLTIANQIMARLSELQEILEETDSTTGALSERGKQLHQKHLVESNRFSDSSISEKQNPDKFTFDNVVCFWHGKVSKDYFRLYFQWPIKESPYNLLKIHYIGPHL